MHDLTALLVFLSSFCLWVRKIILASEKSILYKAPNKQQKPEKLPMSSRLVSHIC